MRDDQVYRLNEISARRSMLLLRQFEFIETRIESYEAVLSTPKAMLLAIFKPGWLKKTVDEYQQGLLKQRRIMMEKAMAKPVLTKVGHG